VLIAFVSPQSNIYRTSRNNTSITMPSTTKTRNSLQPVDNNVQRVPPTTPGTKLRQVKEELETQKTENQALRGNIDNLVKVLGKLDLVKTTVTSNDKGNKDKESKKAAKCPVASYKTAYKFYCDALPKKQQESGNLQQLWKDASPEIRAKYTQLAQADKARHQAEMDAYNKEQKALELYYEKKKQEQAMAFFEAHLEAQAALEKTQKEQGKTKKDKIPKDPDAPKFCTSSYMYFAQDMRATAVKKNPEAKVTEISKILGEMWKELDAKKKAKYEDMATVDRERYAKDKAVYDSKVADRKEVEDREKEARLEQDKKEAMELLESQPHHSIVNGEDMSVISDLTATKATKKKKDPNAPKRALTAYNYFMQENCEKIKAKLGDKVTNAELFAEVGKQWKELAPRNKTKYEKLAKKDQERHAKEVKEYVPSNATTK
jgi:HMG (high mobility group) box